MGPLDSALWFPYGGPSENIRKRGLKATTTLFATPVTIISVGFRDRSTGWFVADNKDSTDGRGTGFAETRDGGRSWHSTTKQAFRAEALPAKRRYGHLWQIFLKAGDAGHHD